MFAYLFPLDTEYLPYGGPCNKFLLEILPRNKFVSREAQVCFICHKRKATSSIICPSFAIATSKQAQELNLVLIYTDDLILNF